ncbi:MAG TPA: GntR family transcriptional regulator [Bordetella sp.]
MSDISYDPFPKYLQIREIMLRWLASLQPGDKLPTEEQLGKRFSVSRLTVRQALHTLEEEGIIARRPGVGTWLSRRPDTPVDNRLTGPIEEFSALGLAFSARPIRQGTIDAPADVAAALGLPPGKRIYEVHRLRIVDGAPLLWLEVYLPTDLGRKVAKAAVDGLFVPVLRRLYDQDVREQYQTIEALSASAELAEMLQVEPGSSILSVNRLFVDATGRRVVFFKTRFRADRYFYTVNLPLARPRG